MYRHILKIGNAKYTFNQAALCAFVAEAKMREDAAAPDPPSRSGPPKEQRGPPGQGAAGREQGSGLRHTLRGTEPSTGRSAGDAPPPGEGRRAAAAGAGPDDRIRWRTAGSGGLGSRTA